MKILLAEDDFGTRKFMTNFLSKYGECDVTVDGTQKYFLTYTLNKVNVKDINVKDADIEEIIRRLYKEGVADNA